MPKITKISAHRDYTRMVEKTLWECSECDGTLFRLTTDGCVYCYSCNEQIGDIKTVHVEAPDDGSDS